MDARRRRTDVVAEGIALAPSFVDPRAVYIVAFIMVKIFLGISDDGWWACGGDITEQCPRGTRIEDRSERSTGGERFD